MSYRPTDWSPVGCDHDPVPGDPDRVRAAAATYKRLAEAVDRASANLRSISYDAHVSEAVDALRQRAGEVHEQIQAIQGLCEVGAGALEPYAGTLESAQATSLRALEAARAAAEEARSYERHRSEVASMYNASSDQVEREGLRESFYSYDRQVSACMGQVRQAQATIEAACKERNAAANRAITLLKEALAHSPARDSLWDKVTDLGRKILEAVDSVLQAIKPALEAISTLLSVASLVVAFIPGAQAIAAGLSIASFAVSATLFAINVVHNGLAVANGELSAEDFMGQTAIDTVMLGVQAVPAAKGVRSLLKAGKAGAQVASSAARTTTQLGRAGLDVAKNGGVAAAEAVGKTAGKAAGKTVEEATKAQRIAKTVVDKGRSLVTGPIKSWGVAEVKHQYFHGDKPKTLWDYSLPGRAMKLAAASAAVPGMPLIGGMIVGSVLLEARDSQR